MAPQLRILIVFTEHLVSIPSTTWKLITLCNSSWRGIQPPFLPFEDITHMWFTLIYADKHTYTKLKNQRHMLLKTTFRALLIINMLKNIKPKYKISKIGSVFLINLKLNRSFKEQKSYVTTTQSLFTWLLTNR